MFGVAGLWWIDLQIDGVRRGGLAAAPPSRLPGPGAIIAASCTSPLDVLYLAAIFDPVFTAARPGSRALRPLSLLAAVAHAFAPPPEPAPPSSPGKAPAEGGSGGGGGGAMELPALLRAHPRRPVVVFPEATTTNGRGVLPFAAGSALRAAPAPAPVFPVSLRYTPADVTTPVPGPRAAGVFLWNLLSRPSHCIRVRVARREFNVEGARGAAGDGEGGEDGEDAVLVGGEGEGEGGEEDGEGRGEDSVADRVADALARLGRVQRVGLGVREKRAFVRAFTRQRRWW